MTILYPVAETGEAAMAQPRGFAARERQAAAMAGGEVVFVTEAVGPAFASREAALDAYAGRLDDDRPGRTFAAPPEARWCALRPVAPADMPRRRKPVKPVMKDGRRWPAPPEAAPQALWRLSVSYWKIGGAMALLDPARHLRKDRTAESLDARTIRKLAEQPMRAVRPQQPLDIGLFETRLPENPDILMPDE